MESREKYILIKAWPSSIFDVYSNCPRETVIFFSIHWIMSGPIFKDFSLLGGINCYTFMMYGLYFFCRMHE